MARQRRRERDRHRAGGGGGYRGLVLALALIALGCGGERTAPTGLGDRPERPAGFGRSASPLLGAWQVTLVFDSGFDITTTTTTWRFESDGTCEFERESLSAVEGVPRTVRRSCTYVDRGSSVELTFVGADQPESLPYTVPLGTTDRLLLEGVEYQRVE